MPGKVPNSRIQACNRAPVREEGRYVVYWMTAFRRPGWNFALQRAVERARERGRPLVILEALRSGYPHASDRLHRFVLEGMAANARAFARRPVLYHPWVERKEGEGKGLLEALAAEACLVVTDDWPCFFLPKMVRAAADRLEVRVEKVDSNGLYPMRAVDRVFTTAFSLRAFLQKRLPPHLEAMPAADPLRGSRLPRLDSLPAAVLDRWPEAGEDLLAGRGLEDLPIDHEVAPVDLRGGPSEGMRLLERFLEERLDRYAGDRNDLDCEATSGLSPYLHFGHVSAHQVFAAVAEREGWTARRLSKETGGKRRGWWGMSEDSEAFLDQLVTWRELGFNLCAHATDYDRYASLPEWARETLEDHEDDERPHRYTMGEFEEACTHDEVWNAAQRQLLREGRIHNYLRMLWGKKILEWSASPRHALRVMIRLNDRYALDGRDPNSYSGIFWCLGRYDRAWGPERPIFGKIRYMSSESTARKLKVRGYLERYGP